jgi:hypothetical protein
MRLRHAAALALAGWYLMLPRYDLNGFVLDKAPLSTWKIFNEYDSSAQCEEIRQQISRAAQDFIDEHEKRSETEGLSQAMVVLSARCIAKDDPRLKSHLGH